MKKFFAKLALAFLPVVAYLCFFVAFEPNNYFGLHPVSENTSSIISKLRTFQRTGGTAIILGDSRLAQFDPAIVEDAAGESFINLAFGGASLEESIDLFYYAVGENPEINRVVLGLSFYTLNTNYGSASRTATIKTQLQNPLAYIFNLEYNINTMQNFVYILQGVQTGAGGETAVWAPEDYLDSATGAPLPYRANLIRYAASLYGNCAAPGTLAGAETETQLAAAMLACTAQNSKYLVNQDQLLRLLEMAQYCEDNSIALTIVLPPMHPSVKMLVCDPLGITGAIEQVLLQLHAAEGGYVQVLDYEWGEATWLPPGEDTDAYFYDGFHIDTEHGLQSFTKTLFAMAVNGIQGVNHGA